MDRFYIIYKERILAGPMPEEDAERKLIKLKQCFRNVTKVPVINEEPEPQQCSAERK